MIFLSHQIFFVINIEFVQALLEPPNLFFFPYRDYRRSPSDVPRNCLRIVFDKSNAFVLEKVHHANVQSSQNKYGTNIKNYSDMLV